MYRFVLPLILAAAFAASSFAQTSAKAEAKVAPKPVVVAAPVVAVCQNCPQAFHVAPVRTIAAPVVGFAVAAPQAVGGRLRDWFKNRHHILPHSTTKSFAVTRER